MMERLDLDLKRIKFNVANINCCTEVEGPYKRLCIWFQGCNINCKGCCNKSYQPLLPKNIMDLDEIINAIIDSKEKYDIEGVTYSGGEPTLQIGLPYLTHEIKKLGLGVISFTGHRYEEVKEVLDGCDMIIDGEFKLDKLDSKRTLLGSTNQNIILITDRYKDNLNWFNNENKLVEIGITDNITINGDKI